MRIATGLRPQSRASRRLRLIQANVLFYNPSFGQDREAGALERVHHAFYVAVREQEGREASPTVAIIDSQIAKGA
jgi:hypothetical protein